MMMYTKLFVMMLLSGYVAAIFIDDDVSDQPDVITDVDPRRCYVCNGTNCDDAEEFNDDENRKPVSVMQCPPERPHCATYASAPSFISVLACAKPAVTPCSLHTPDKGTYLITCVCATDLCNAPFSREVRTKLSNSRNWSNNVSVAIGPKARGTSSNEGRINMKTAVPVPKDMQLKATSLLTTISTVYLDMTKTRLFEEYSGPRSEFLKHHTTIPSDDEDDDGEGSGVDQEPKTIEPSVSTTTEPSTSTSHLPEKASNAQGLFVNFLMAVSPLVIYLIF